jgi:hypothetical protein
MTEKTCKCCGKTKSIELFPIDSRGGIRCHCMPCYSSQQKIRHQKWLARGNAGTKRPEVPLDQTTASLSMTMIERSVYKWR